VATLIRDDHYPVCRLDIRKDSEFATGKWYPKTAFKPEPDIRTGSGYPIRHWLHSTTTRLHYHYI